MSEKPGSSIIHKEDGGLVYSSIRNDGLLIHWCDKCGKIWVSKERPSELVSGKSEISAIEKVELEKNELLLKMLLEHRTPPNKKIKQRRLRSK